MEDDNRIKMNKGENEFFIEIQQLLNRRAVMPLMR